MTPNKYLRDKINVLHQELQSKPEKLGYFSNNVASLLNAYREGDISFEKARELILDMIRKGTSSEIEVEREVTLRKNQ